MSQLEDFLQNPDWYKYYEYAQRGYPNNGFFRRWPQGSIGGNSPMWIYSNEYSHLAMKHGQNSVLPYRGNVKKFTPAVTDALRRQVVDCSAATTDPVGCQIAGIRRAFTTDASREGYLRPSGTQHPYNVSYHTGYSPYMTAIPPWGCQD